MSDFGGGWYALTVQENSYRHARTHPSVGNWRNAGRQQLKRCAYSSPNYFLQHHKTVRGKKNVKEAATTLAGVFRLRGML